MSQCLLVRSHSWLFRLPSPIKMGSRGVQFVLELSAFLGGLPTSLLKCWDYRLVWSHLTYVVLWTEPRASCSPESHTSLALNPGFFIYTGQHFLKTELHSDIVNKNRAASVISGLSFHPTTLSVMSSVLI